MRSNDVKKQNKTFKSTFNVSLCSWLKRARQEKGLTMRDLGEKMGLPHSFFGKIENQERRLDVREFAMVCNAIGVNPLEGLNVALAASEAANEMK